jgi:septal ring factor EnvC (AmiA/AmiB activator)
MASMQAQFAALQATIAAAVTPLQQALENQRQVNASLELRLQAVADDLATLKGDASLARRVTDRVTPGSSQQRRRTRSTEPERSSDSDESVADGVDDTMPEVTTEARERRRLGKLGRTTPPS